MALPVSRQFRQYPGFFHKQSFKAWSTCVHMADMAESSPRSPPTPTAAEETEPPLTKRAKHVSSKWQESWRKYRFIPCRKGNSYAFCTLCNADICISGGGVHEVKSHCRTVKHTGLLKTVQLQPTISTAIAAASNLHEVSIQDQVTKAELYFSLFVAEHNLSFSTDHFTKLCKKMFPDSRIDSPFSCARTKVRSIITHALAAPTVNADATDACATRPFSILCDGGNDKYNKSTLALWSAIGMTVVEKL